MEIDRARKLHSIICYYGIEKQLYKLVEEMADVEILLDQLRLMMSRKERTFIEETKTEKIEQTLKRMEEMK